MERHELDNVMFKLANVLEVYGKKLSNGAKLEWQETFLGKEPRDCLRALDDYKRTEEYAPKPANIEKLISGYRISNNKNKTDYSHFFNLIDDPETLQALRDDERINQERAQMTPRDVGKHRFRKILSQVDTVQCTRSDHRKDSELRKIRKDERENY